MPLPCYCNSNYWNNFTSNQSKWFMYATWPIIVQGYSCSTSNGPTVHIHSPNSTTLAYSYIFYCITFGFLIFWNEGGPWSQCNISRVNCCLQSWCCRERCIFPLIFYSVFFFFSYNSLLDFLWFDYIDSYSSFLFFRFHFISTLLISMVNLVQFFLFQPSLLSAAGNMLAIIWLFKYAPYRSRLQIQIIKYLFRTSSYVRFDIRHTCYAFNKLMQILYI